MKKDKLITCIEGFCPSNIAEEWDNCGFQVNCETVDVNRLLVSLEVTNKVIDEAIANQVDFILTHHPLIFGGIKSIDCNHVIGKYITRLIENHISVYSCHTSFDKIPGGNNDYLGQLLELDHIRPFENDNGFCRKGDVKGDLTLRQIIDRASKSFGIDQRHFKFTGQLDTLIRTVGWCTGAGSEFIEDAFDEGCDLYITGDFKYHQGMAAKEMGICVLDAGHYGTEKIFAENMAAILRKLTSSEQIEILESSVDINPFG